MAERPAGHESSAVAVRDLLRIGAIIAVAVAAAVITIGVAVNRWAAPQRYAVAARRGAIPPAPRLQPDPHADLVALRAQKQALLSKWAWTDTTRQFARIPIERAMEIYARQHAALAAPDAGTATEAGAAPAGGERSLRAPAHLLSQVSFDQRLGASVPLSLAFRDVHGADVRLQDLLQGRPTVLVLGYYGCANLCGVVRTGVAHAVARSGLTAGRQFNVVVTSIDPRETPAAALIAQQADELVHPDADVASWHYLTGAQAAIVALSQAIGFSYLYDPRNAQYAHAAGIVLLTPQGTIAQYLFGVQFAPRTLRLALVSASRGHIGNVVDRLLLLCCDYDASTGRYSLLINRVMQVLGVLTALALCGLIVMLRRTELGRRTDPQRRDEPPGSTP
ncbi:MAG TPA: SCO family protein [Steroidobacteraceae bacterium]